MTSIAFNEKPTFRHIHSLPFPYFSIRWIVEDLQTRHFADLRQNVDIFFVTGGSLASIYHDEHKATIYVHQLLNHPETPLEVFTMIIKHELLHLRISPVNSGGNCVVHSAEFWQSEAAISPERRIAWRWIFRNFHKSLKVQEKLERVDVLQNWKHAWSRERISIDSLAQDDSEI